MNTENQSALTTKKNINEGVVELLTKNPGLKITEIARCLNIERREVNQCLSVELAGQAVQDSNYRWRLREESVPNTSNSNSASKSLTEIGRLTQYYLECIGQDSGEGVSVFSTARYGAPDYAELPALPMLGGDTEWWNSPGVMRVLSQVKADRTNLQAWLGYPVRMREHRTAKWRGFFVEPVFLWPIELPDGPGGQFRLLEDQPQPNFSVLRNMAMGDPTAVLDEAARLDEDLGLNNPLEDRPETDELIERLVKVRPDWDWNEPVDPYNVSLGLPLSEIKKSGIFNRVIVIPGKRSPYTQGLEAELKSLGKFNEVDLIGTALGSMLLGGLTERIQLDDNPLIEVAPMNMEQRQAVNSALVAPLTVVTGPPGTGKSQVVTNLLVNAAWRGMKVLFASKNNKAVDVVEARVNGLGNRPVLLRLGSREYQEKLSSYLTALLSGQVGEEEHSSYEEGLTRHNRLTEKLLQLERTQRQTLEARNTVDRLEASVEAYRSLLGEERFNSLDSSILSTASNALSIYDSAVDALDPSAQGIFGRLGLMVNKTKRKHLVSDKAAQLDSLALHLGVSILKDKGGLEIRGLREWSSTLSTSIEAAHRVADYQTALNGLRAVPSFEKLAAERLDATVLIAENSTKFWRDWVQLAPTRLNQAQRKDIADYIALLQVITGPGGETVNPAVRNRSRVLQARVSASFCCWAVTSLSVRGKVPFEPAHFDLVVIDEASQCDIASALPLLYRAKRAVIIGDPMQLRHISAVGRKKDSDLLHKFDLVDSRAGWMYSVNSLYDLAAGVAQPSQLINLRDHHRSHGQIIDFSNQYFYNGRLRVATRYTSLKTPANRNPGVHWQDVKGHATRPLNGGAQNHLEAQAIVEALHDLLVIRDFHGTVGVVTPFRAQAQLIQALISKFPGLVEAGNRSRLLVDTVHKFQGDERDVIYFSPVISERTPDGALSFLRSNGNLFNVAISRARGLLHIVGDREAVSSCGVDYLEAFSAYVSCLRDQPTVDVTEPARESSFGAEYPTVANPERVSDWERFFYRALYRTGVRPIPQYTVEQYDLDFAIISGNRRLNIEIDGERYHRSWSGELCLRDQLRNQRLIELGWEVKRFWVYEIRDRLPDCINYVNKWLKYERD